MLFLTVAGTITDVRGDIQQRSQIWPRHYCVSLRNHDPGYNLFIVYHSHHVKIKNTLLSPVFMLAVDTVQFDLFYLADNKPHG